MNQSRSPALEMSLRQALKQRMDNRSLLDSVLSKGLLKEALEWEAKLLSQQATLQQESRDVSVLHNLKDLLFLFHTISILGRTHKSIRSNGT